jgi:hypothetical protein
MMRTFGNLDDLKSPVKETAGNVEPTQPPLEKGEIGEALRDRRIDSRCRSLSDL